jgi:hypothetical protein
MSSAQLKILACVFMLVDHIGAILFPKVLLLRIIGRLAFPIFVYLIAEGYRKTKDMTDYIGRVVLFALISQLAFNAAFLNSAFKPDSLYLNVMFTLAMGLYGIYLYDKNNKIFFIIIIALVCELLNTDYGAFGVLLVFVSNKYHNDFKKLSKSYIIVMLFYIIKWFITISLLNPTIPLTNLILNHFTIEPIALLSLIFIKLYNGERGAKLKLLFYSFYPAHLFLLYIIKELS